jgi:SSS family solute:Na+ symporter
MQWIDWVLMVAPLLLVLGMGIYTQRYVKGVADFMSGGRLAGRYLLAVAGGEMGAAAVVFVANLEMMGKSGFALWWWGWLLAPIGLVFSLFGFVTYRFRQTRAMTLAQYFELRYSRSFRIFTGVLGFGAGLVNYGIIPAVEGRFFVYFLQLPTHTSILSFMVPTYVLLTALFLAITLCFSLLGGQITIMVTDCLEGMISHGMFLIVIAGLLLTFSWSQISHTLADRPPGESYLNPFDCQKVSDFNFWFSLMALFTGLYGTMAWQNAGGFRSAALSAHESRMGGILGRWRGMGNGAVKTLLGICALTFLAHPQFAAQAVPAKQALQQIAQPQIRSQMQLPMAISFMLSPGVKGALCIMLLMGTFGGNASHLHSWGGILVQDVIQPLRKKPFSPRQHIFALRMAMIGVASFAFLFGVFFHQTEYIIMWWQVTTAIFVGGAGAAIIGGLYWKKGTAAGAWTGLLTGSILAVGGIVLRQIYGNHLPLNGTQISFLSCLIACLLYVVVSYLTCKQDFNMDRMLHRGAYADPDSLVRVKKKGFTWGKLIGLSEEFTRGDKWLAGGMFAWEMVLTVIAVAGTAWYLLSPWSMSVWISFWHVIVVIIPVSMAVITSVWFTWGGLRDIRRLFKQLAEHRSNPLDNGFVVGHQNRDEMKTPETAPVSKEPVSV